MSCCENEFQKARAAQATSRFNLLYDRWLATPRDNRGETGKLFHARVMVISFLNVGLQALVKLPKLGAMASMTGSAHWLSGYYQGLLVPCYWMFFSALVVNAVFPALTLTRTNRWVQCQLCAIINVAVESVYIYVYMLAAVASISVNPFLPVHAVDILASWLPVARLYAACRGIEYEDAHPTNSHRGRSCWSNLMGVDEHAPNYVKPLSLPTAFVHLSSTLGVLVFVLFVATRSDVYPFPKGRPGYRCAPCSCTASGTLRNCDIPASLGSVGLVLDDKGITDIRRNAFRGNDMLMSLHISGNDIAVLRHGAFDGLDGLGWLYMNDARDMYPFPIQSHVRKSAYVGNNIKKIEPGAFHGIGLFGARPASVRAPRGRPSIQIRHRGTKYATGQNTPRERPGAS